MGHPDSDHALPPPAVELAAFEELRNNVDNSLRSFGQELRCSLERWSQFQEEVAEHLSRQQMQQWQELLDGPIASLLERHAGGENAARGPTPSIGIPVSRAPDKFEVDAPATKAKQASQPTSGARETRASVATTNETGAAASAQAKGDAQLSGPRGAAGARLDDLRGNFGVDLEIPQGEPSIEGDELAELQRFTGGELPSCSDSWLMSLSEDTAKKGQRDSMEPESLRTEDRLYFTGRSPPQLPRPVARKLSFSPRDTNAAGLEQPAAGLPCEAPFDGQEAATVSLHAALPNASRMERMRPQPLDLDNDSPDLPRNRQERKEIPAEESSLSGESFIIFGEPSPRAGVAGRAARRSQTKVPPVRCQKSTCAVVKPCRLGSSIIAYAVRSQAYACGDALLVVLGVALAIYATQRRALCLASEMMETVGSEIGTLPSVTRELHLLLLWEMCFCIVAFVDVTMRALGLGWKYLARPGRYWNIFDALVTTLATVLVTRSWIQASDADDVPRCGVGFFLIALRGVRLPYVAYVAKPLQRSRIFHEFRLLVDSLSSVLLLAFWVSLVLVSFFVGVALFLADGVLAYSVEADSFQNVAAEELRLQFGDVGASLTSMLKAMSSGAALDELTGSLALLSAPYRLVFWLCSVLGGSVALGLTFAALVEAYSQKSRSSRSLPSLRAQCGKAAFVESFQAALRTLDTDGRGRVRVADLESRLRQEELVGAHIHAMELNSDHVKTLAEILDLEQTGSIGIDQLISGCLHIEGRARAVDVVMLQYEVGVVRGMVQALGELLETRLVPTSGDTIS
eukprot:TRINITY_DN13035_c1_g1_i1.p1 TRINITY_DN13035_c1_g1~~TRINITY_DN13035_c1_g1_i1.p1  ORF type:complete len:863 (+),score=134.81 TRINITY_DN13035_c1_g1_i1:193-2589(+)